MNKSEWYLLGMGARGEFKVTVLIRAVVIGIGMKRIWGASNRYSRCRITSRCITWRGITMSYVQLVHSPVRSSEPDFTWGLLCWLSCVCAGLGT